MELFASALQLDRRALWNEIGETFTLIEQKKKQIQFRIINTVLTS